MSSIITQLRSFRVGEMAVFDFVASYIAMYLLARRYDWDIERAMWAVLPLSVAAHAIFGQPTPLTRMTLNLSSHYAVKAIMLFCVYKVLTI